MPSLPVVQGAPLACVPGALPDGYAYRFDADAFDDVARWVANERRCCPFLTFALELSPEGGPLWARLTGPEGTRAFLDAELPAPGA